MFWGHSNSKYCHFREKVYFLDKSNKRATQPFQKFTNLKFHLLFSCLHEEIRHSRQKKENIKEKHEADCKAFKPKYKIKNRVQMVFAISNQMVRQ